MQLGICYYPEHWDESRWATDAKMMREIGLDIVRIAEFAWAKMEPREGAFDFDWLDRAIGTLSGAGLQVVLGTPTASPPAWLSRNYPDTLPVDKEGRRRNFGGRRHYCPNNETVLALSRRIVSEMAKRYGDDARVIGWQIDNELGGSGTARCYCPVCAEKFRAWLQKKHKTLDALNEAWATVFWSQTYFDWSQITPPILQFNQPNPSHMLEYYRFTSDSMVAFQQTQIDLLRQLAPKQWLTTNLMGLFDEIDAFDLAANLDFITWDNYPTGNLDRWAPMLYGEEKRTAYAYDVGDPYVTGFSHDLNRGLLNKPFWIMEQQAGHVNWGYTNPAPKEGTVRLWTWHALTSGADACVYFRWRACLFAQEQYHSGLLNHDATPDIGYREVVALNGERETMKRIVEKPLQAEVAMLFNFDDLWALQIQPHQRDFTYLRHLFVWYRACQRLGIAVDIVPITEQLTQRLSSYKIVLAPTLHLADESLANALTSYVNRGGTLMTGVRSGFKTRSNRVTPQPLPGELRELLGVTVTDWHSLPPGVSYKIDADIEAYRGEASVWAEALQPYAESVVVHARYAEASLAGAAAITNHVVGRGHAIACGFHPTLNQAMNVVRRIAINSDIKTMELPDGLIASRRGDETMLMNFTESPLAMGNVEIQPRGVWVGDECHTS